MPPRLLPTYTNQFGDIIHGDIPRLDPLNYIYQTVFEGEFYTSKSLALTKRFINKKRDTRCKWTEKFE